MLMEPGNRLQTRFDPQLLQEIADMLFYCVDGNIHTVCHVAVLLALAQICQNLVFLFRETFPLGPNRFLPARSPLQLFFGKKRFFARRAADGNEQLFLLAAFVKVAACASGHHARQVSVAVVTGQHKGFCFRQVFQNPIRQFCR